MAASNVTVTMLKCGVPCDSRAIREIAKSVIVVLSQNETPVNKDKA